MSTRHERGSPALPCSPLGAAGNTASHTEGQPSSRLYPTKAPALSTRTRLTAGVWGVRLPAPVYCLCSHPLLPHLPCWSAISTPWVYPQSPRPSPCAACAVWKRVHAHKTSVVSKQRACGKWLLLWTANAGYKKIHTGKECAGSGEESLGEQASVEACRAACVAKKGAGCKYFIFGTGLRAGNCWWESTCHATMANSYDVYEVEPSMFCTGTPSARCCVCGEALQFYETGRHTPLSPATASPVPLSLFLSSSLSLFLASSPRPRFLSFSPILSFSLFSPFLSFSLFLVLALAPSRPRALCISWPALPD